MRSWPASAVKSLAKPNAGRKPALVEAGGGEGVRILGVDPGLRHTGWGVIEARGNQLSFISAGVIEPDPKAPMSERLRQLFESVCDIVSAQSPQECAIEESFVNKNPTSTLKLGHARAAAMLAPAIASLPVFEYKPNLVKKSVVGAGHAEKAQVTAMIKVLLPGSKLETKDAADALAVAVCHAHHRATSRRTAAARGAL